MKMHWQNLCREDKQTVIDSRIKVGCEIFASCLSQANALVKNEFQKSSTTVWHDADKNRALDIAKLIFQRAVNYSDVKEIAEDVHTPEIEEIKVTQESGNGKETVLNDEIGGF